MSRRQLTGAKGEKNLFLPSSTAKPRDTNPIQKYASKQYLWLKE
jgi:hypothetical protein